MIQSPFHPAADRALEAFRRLSNVAENEGLGRQLADDDVLEPGYITLRGKRLANFGVCSYLGISQDDRLIEAGIDGMRRYGSSYSSSTSYTAVPLYRDLRERLKAIFDAQVVIGATTTLVHHAGLPVMVCPGDDVVVDTQVHASVQSVTPTLVLNGSQVETIGHNDLDALQSMLERRRGGTPLWYLTEGVFSMFGDTAPAERIRQLLERYPDFHVYCDDAHGFGWDGANGSGHFLDRAGWHDRLVISVGLAKAFGSMGGVIATRDEDLAGRIITYGGTLMFGGPIPPAVLGASVAAADIFLSPEIQSLQSALTSRIDLVNQMARDISLPLDRLDRTPLWYLTIGSSRHAIAIAARMLRYGFYTNLAGYPVVPRGHSGLRFTITNDNQPAEIERLLIRLKEAREEVLGRTAFEIDLTEESGALSPGESQRSEP